MSEIEQVVEGEVVLAEAQHTALRPVRLSPKTLALLGSTLAFVGREIVPRLAAVLLSAWDRRVAGQQPVVGAQGDGSTALTGGSSEPRSSAGARNRHRHGAGRGRV